MTNQVYKKVGRRYVPVGYSDGWFGFPADGVWVVQNKPERKSSECMMRIGEIQDMRPTIDFLIEYRDEIVKYLMDNPMIDISYNDYVSNMIKNLTAKSKRNESNT